MLKDAVGVSKIYIACGYTAYSGETAQPFQRNGMLFRFKRHKAC